MDLSQTVCDIEEPVPEEHSIFESRWGWHPPEKVF